MTAMFAAALTASFIQWGMQWGQPLIIGAIAFLIGTLLHWQFGDPRRHYVLRPGEILDIDNRTAANYWLKRARIVPLGMGFVSGFSLEVTPEMRSGASPKTIHLRTTYRGYRMLRKILLQNQSSQTYDVILSGKKTDPIIVGIGFAGLAIPVHPK